VASTSFTTVANEINTYDLVHSAVIPFYTRTTSKTLHTKQRNQVT